MMPPEVREMAGIFLLAGLFFAGFISLLMNNLAMVTFFAWLLTLALWYGFG